MIVHVVCADDHDYDAMSQWLVGVFSSFDKAYEAMEIDRKRYVRLGGEKSRYNFDITEVEIDTYKPSLAI